MERMEQLQPFLGHWECKSTVYVEEANTISQFDGLFVGTLSPILGGTWYEWDYTQTPNDLHPSGQRCRYVFGWNAGLDVFTAIYFDDRGNHLVEHTPTCQWDDGHLRFVGDTVLPGYGNVTFLDDFTTDGPGHLRNTVWITSGSSTKLHAVLEFHSAGKPVASSEPTANT